MLPNRDEMTEIDRPNVAHAVARRRAAALAGHQGDEPAARRSLADTAPSVRATALGALARMGRLGADDVRLGPAAADPEVRRRACEESVGIEGIDLAVMLGDASPSVVEAAAWALGE